MGTIKQLARRRANYDWKHDRPYQHAPVGDHSTEDTTCEDCGYVVCACTTPVCRAAAVNTVLAKRSGFIGERQYLVVAMPELYSVGHTVDLWDCEQNVYRNRTITAIEPATGRIYYE